MKSSFINLFSAAVLLIYAVSCAGGSPQPRASLTSVEGLDVVSLYGSWEEMGKQYGELASGHLRHVNDFISGVIGDDAAKRDSISMISQKLFSRYPHRFKQFFKGMERTSGLTMEQLVMNNAVEYAEGFFCSGIAAWGDYASGDLVYGRNYDAASYSPIGEDVIVTVFHPSDGSLATAIIGYAGEIYAVNAINEKGVFMELNNGMPTAGWDIDFERFATTTTLLEMMLDADDLDYCDAYFKSSRSFASFIIGVADENEARSYEFCAAGVENAAQSNPEGLIVQTNYYVSPNWTYPTPSDEGSWNALTRRRNLLALSENFKGQIDEDTMQRIIATPIADGGAMQPLTMYQYVYTPGTMNLRIRVGQAPGWISVSLKEFLR